MVSEGPVGLQKAVPFDGPGCRVRRRVACAWQPTPTQAGHGCGRSGRCAPPVHAAAAIRLLMLTGCRCGEVLTLRWKDVALERNEIRLRDSKTGPRVVPLSPAATRVLAGIPRPLGNPWVIAGREPGARQTHIADYWYRVRERAGLDDVRLHDLRHSFASRALALGEDLTMIGKLLGHRKIQTTARYAHLARDSVKESAALVAASIAADIMP